MRVRRPSRARTADILVTPLVHTEGVNRFDSAPTTATAADFAAAARVLSRAARAQGLVGPSYRCPPRLVGVDRTLRRRNGGTIVSVRVRGRPWAAVWWVGVSSLSWAVWPAG